LASISTGLHFIANEKGFHWAKFNGIKIVQLLNIIYNILVIQRHVTCAGDQL
jgi:hypothetical protein